MDASDIRGMDDLDNLIEAARCLGLVQARKAFGQYGPDDAASEHGLHASISERSARLRAEVEALKSLSERLKLEAQIHAQEARTANATIAECYQAVAGGKGEPGNWHGAQPVRDCIEALRADAERADAERYRHLKAHHVREYPDDNGTLCIEFWCDFDNWDDIDAAIDAARAAQGVE